MLSVVIPSYNEGRIVCKTAAIIGNALQNENIPYELIFVNDGSKDETWGEIEGAQLLNPNVKGVNFSRNFGKEAAIFAGLAYSKGDCCAVIDCDLQHPPETLIEMYHLWQQGYEVIEGSKISRGKESFLYKFSAKCFYGLISYATKMDMSKASDFKVLDRRAVNVLISMPEKHVFFRALSSWIGFKSIRVEFDVRERQDGESKWSKWSLIKYAVSNFTSFSAVPMQIVTVFGILFLLFALILGVESLYLYASGKAMEGFTTVIILLLIIGSIIMISLGIIGYFIEKIYEEIKGRPRYIVSKTIDNQKDTIIKN